MKVKPKITGKKKATEKAEREKRAREVRELIIEIRKDPVAMRQIRKLAHPN